MTSLTREEKAKVFSLLHSPDSSSASVASSNRNNSDTEYDGDGVQEIFDEMLDENMDVAEKVHKRFRA